MVVVVVLPVAMLMMALAAPMAAGAAALEGVEVLGERGDAVRLHLSAPVLPQARRLPTDGVAPERIYIDLPGVWLDARTPGVIAGRGRVLRVRTGQFDLGTARVVVDLAAAMPFALDATAHALTVTLGAAPEPAAAATPPQLPVRDAPAGPAPGFALGTHRRPPQARLAPLAAAVMPPLPEPAGAPTERLAPLSARVQPLLPEARDPAGLALLAPDVRAGPPHAPAATRAPPLAAVGPSALNEPPPAERARAAAPPSPPAQPPARRRGAAPPEMVVIIDAGHGGRDPGAAGVGGVLEKDVVLALTQVVAERLLARLPVSVVLTRADDSFVPLERRLALPGEGATLFVSLHANACEDASARGLEVFYGGGPVRTASTGGASPQAALLGRLIGRALGARLGGMRGDARPGGFTVLVRNPVPSALVEIGYLTHPEEAARAQDPAYQRELADALVDGVAEYLRAAVPPL